MRYLVLRVGDGEYMRCWMNKENEIVWSVRGADDFPEPEHYIATYRITDETDNEIALRVYHKFFRTSKLHSISEFL